MEHYRDGKNHVKKIGLELDVETTLYPLHIADDQVVVAQYYDGMKFMAR